MAGEQKINPIRITNVHDYGKSLGFIPYLNSRNSKGRYVVSNSCSFTENPCLFLPVERNPKYEYYRIHGGYGVCIGGSADTSPNKSFVSLEKS
jgi:hypothetical protein